MTDTPVYFFSYQPDENGKCYGWHRREDHKEDINSQPRFNMTDTKQ